MVTSSAALTSVVVRPAAARGTRNAMCASFLNIDYSAGCRGNGVRLKMRDQHISSGV